MNSKRFLKIGRLAKTISPGNKMGPPFWRTRSQFLENCWLFSRSARLGITAQAFIDDRLSLIDDAAYKLCA